jgi:hypothetical protein
MLRPLKRPGRARTVDALRHRHANDREVVVVAEAADLEVLLVEEEAVVWSRVANL